MVFVTGVFNLTLHYFLEAVRDVTKTNVYSSLNGFVSLWTWPKRLKMKDLAELFNDAKRTANVKAGHFKCSASEGLSLYLILSHWATHILPADTCTAEREAFVALCDIIDCMRATAFIHVAGSTIVKAVELFLELYDKAYGLEWSTPKFHWMLHFGDFCDRFKELVSCWPLERKHKTPKGYGAEVRDTRKYEQSVLHEVICKRVAELLDPDTFEFLRCGLFKPRKATNDILEWCARALCEDTASIVCYMAHSARYSAQVVCSVGDCILFRHHDGSLQAGEVWCNLELEGELIALVQLWKFMSEQNGAGVFQVTDILYPVFSEDIIDVATWCMYSATQVKIVFTAYVERD